MSGRFRGYITIDFSEERKERAKIKKIEEQEMDRAWGHYVESGNFDAVRNLREQRELSNYYMNRWD